MSVCAVPVLLLCYGLLVLGWLAGWVSHIVLHRGRR